ncbi:peptidase domain-containing ABC transporter [Gluconobacter frateurii]|uniref:peptidase domain-containing ABC transporter n=1 Tax=Gluconobacter frateurii TaxID=38308 RepID=UPI001F066E00|nr:peptidase domain-containing ABC transporter [Gluconobacter frateurii]UMM08933.1 peptidase domain-containing ABC transporter [Gluconobacter frateurii]
MLRDLQFGFGRHVPVILQSEAAECGLACLAMVMGYHGHPIDIATFRRQQGTSSQGTTLREIVGVAGRVGLNARAVRLEIEDLDKLTLPCILHWGMNHFVVLTEQRKQTVIIHDPAVGRREIGPEEFSREFTGVALEVTPTERFERKDERKTLRLRDMFRHVSGLRPALAYLFALSLGLEIIALFSPMVSQIIIDEVLVTGDHDLLTTVACAMVVLLLLQMLVASVRSWAVVMFGSRVSLKWNGSLFEHLTRLPLDYFTRRHIGDVISRFGALSAIQHTLTTDLVQTILDGIMAVGMGVMLFLYGGWLGAIACIAMGLDILLRLTTYGTYRRASEEAVVQDAKSQTHFIETLRNMATVKLLNLRERRQTAWLNSVIDSMNIHLRLQRFDLIFGRLADMIFGADRLIMLVLGANMVMRGHMSVGMLVAFLSYKDQFAGRISSLINTGFKLRMLSIQTDRLSDIVMSDPEPQGLLLPPPSSDEAGRGTLAVRNLSVRYSPDGPWIFRNLSFDIPAGQSVAIVGPSGCGKTTLLKTLMGLQEPSEGEIFMEGSEIRSLTLDGYRSQIAGVLQDDGLFSGSIGDNICGFSESPDQTLIETCAKRAAIHDDIQRTPMRYESLVGDMGSSLSGGQKQRVLLARALYRAPQILFLDEATSHLDEATEAKVAKALRQLHTTRIMVAHRPATIAHADIVFRLTADGLKIEREGHTPVREERPSASKFTSLSQYGQWPQPTVG